MPRPSCKRGHALTEVNAHWHKRADGRRYYTCKKCHALLAKLKYRNNDAHRAAEQTRSRERYRQEHRA